MIFEDEHGKILVSEEVDKLSLLELDNRELHVYDNRDLRKDLMI
jgi:hypothetical protein